MTRPQSPLGAPARGPGVTVPSAVWPLPQKGGGRSCSSLLLGDAHPGLLSSEGEGQVGGQVAFAGQLPRRHVIFWLECSSGPAPCSGSRGRSLSEPQAPGLQGEGSWDPG